MNSEEFDRKLRNTFRDEYEPPRDGLWHDILEGLEQSRKAPVWYWVAPVLILLVSGIMWLASTLFVGDANKQAVNTRTTIVTDSSSHTIPGNSSIPVIDGTPKAADKGHENSTAHLQNVIANHPARHVTNVAPDKTVTPRRHSSTVDLSGNVQPVTSGDNILRDDDDETNLAFNRSYPDFNLHIHFSDAAQPYLLMSLGNKKGKVRTDNNNEQYAPKASKWWFNVGFGPQIAYNSLAINNDSQAYVHKDLWANKEKVTHSGSGFHAHGSMMYKFGKSDRHSFIVESGLFLSFRTENIKMNESSYDIAHRSSSAYNDDYNKIDSYMNEEAWVKYNNTYTKFAVTEAFTSIATNKYGVVTIPVRLQFEQHITPGSFFSLGAGAGLSMIHSRTTSHLNLVSQRQTDMKASTQFTGSWNATLALYTNYNGIGQIGVFTTYQSYANPWKLAGGQYGIKMSDLQFGLMFRAPLTGSAKSAK